MKNIAFIFVLLLASTFVFFAWTNVSQANSAPHIIINEIQTSGASSNDEFIELFNPTDDPIDMKGYKLGKKTKTGSSENALVSAAKFSGIIQAYGYFLISHPNFKDEISADLSYSSSNYSIADDNTIFLRDKDGILIDEVGFGEVDYSNCESSPALNPDSNQSIERTDFIDTDDNAADFSLNNSTSPQNKNVTEDKDGNEESPEANETADDDTKDIESITPNPTELCSSTSSNVRLSEIFPYPEKGDEFVEIVNFGQSCIDVSGWKIMDEAGHKKEFPANSILGSGEYLFLEGNLYLNNDSDTVYLIGKDGDTEGDALDSCNFDKAKKGFSFSFDRDNWRWTSISTPGEDNTYDAEEDNTGKSENGDTSEHSSLENVFLNEIFPNPKKYSDEEFIEIANSESDPVDLFGWHLKDASKGKGYAFKDHILIEPDEYLTIYKPESKLSLNNSKESIYLVNPDGDITSSISYEKSQKNASYGFDGKDWRWSKFSTAGKKNKFDSQPSVKVTNPKHVYKDLYTEFAAKARDKETKKLKYAWDFGDGKKSYLAKTSHKYLDTGKYTVTLTVSDESQAVEKKFTLKVKKYPRPNFEIVKITPNPSGKDSEEEAIDIKNNSEKKVGLDGWKIATGSGEKIYNHPVSKEIILESGEAKTITREFSKFSLNNKGGKVQLVSPDNKVIDEVEYSKEKIAEGEAYAKIDSEWQWVSSSENKKSSEEDSEEINNEENLGTEGEVLGATDENASYYAPPETGYTPEDAFIFFKVFGLLEYNQQEANFCPAIQPANTLTYF